MPDLSVAPPTGLRAPLRDVYAEAAASSHLSPTSRRAAAYWRQVERTDVRAAVETAQRSRRRPLGNSANSSSEITSEPADVVENRRLTRRAERHALRRLAREHSGSIHLRTDDKTGLQRWDDHRVTGCGRTSVMPSGTVGLRLTGGVAGYSGLMTCGSVWVCPVCSAKIAAARAAEIGDVLGWARGEKREISMVTMTVRHHKGHTLEQVWDAVAAGWAQVTSGSSWASESEAAYEQRLAEWCSRGLEWDSPSIVAVPWAPGVPINPVTGVAMTRSPRGWASKDVPRRRIGDAERFGVDGWLRATEVTVSWDHGWHVHVHAVIVRDPSVGGDVYALADRMWARWEKGIQAHGFTALRDSGGLDVRVARAAEKRLAEYLTKQGGDAHMTRWGVEKQGRDMAMEVTHGGAKTGRLGGRTPFQLLADVAEHGDADDLDRWREWVRGSQGRRQLGWSAGLRELVGLSEEELTDDELAQVELDSPDLLILTAETWRAIRDDFSVTLLEVAERSGIGGARRLLKRAGLTYFDPEHVPIEMQ